MTGISEILVLIFLICVILILPRMFRTEPARKAGQKKGFKLTAAMRSGIVLSVLLPLFSGMILRPWTGQNLILFAVIGIFPVVISWSIVWILSGRKG